MRHLQRSVIRVFFFQTFLVLVRAFVVCACVANGVMGVVPATFWLWPVGRQKKNEKKRRYKLIKSLSSNRCLREGRRKKEKKRRKEAVYIARVMGAALGGEPVWWEPLLLQHNRHPLLFLLLLFREIFSPFFLNSRRPALFFFISWAVLPVLPDAPSLLLLLLPPT